MIESVVLVITILSGGGTIITTCHLFWGVLRPHRAEPNLTKSGIWIPYRAQKRLEFARLQVVQINMQLALTFATLFVWGGIAAWRVNVLGPGIGPDKALSNPLAAAMIVGFLMSVIVSTAWLKQKTPRVKRYKWSDKKWPKRLGIHWESSELWFTWSTVVVIVWLAIIWFTLPINLGADLVPPSSSGYPGSEP